MDEKESHGLYNAFKAKDSRFDGRFFVGVSSTGIYCRPVCRAKMPKEENCTFYETASQAEQAGFRPCLLCRPELAPGTSVTDAKASLARRAALMLEENCGSGQSMEEIAGHLGCTGRHLRRVFKEEYNVSPLQYVQTCRLLFAKNLLTDTDISVLDTAMASGFGSLRQFNNVFQKQYRLSPSELRKGTKKKRNSGNEITVSVGYRPPYKWQEILDFLAQRRIKGVEAVENGAYLRAVSFTDKDNKLVYGWIKVSHEESRNLLNITVNSSLTVFLPRILTKIRHLFDLHCNPEAVDETLKSMDNICPGLWIKGLRLPGSFDCFEMAVRAVLGQQITVKAASTLTARLVQAYGTPIETGIEGLTHIFPSPQDILAMEDAVFDNLGTLGIISSRAKAIYELAEQIESGHINFGPGACPEDEMNKLKAIKGIGPWTAEYIAMRAMGWTDAFLETDAGVKKALAPYKGKELIQISEQWRPWRSYAVMSLWNSL